MLLGQDISFDPGGDDDIGGGFVGLSGAARVAANTELFGRVEGALESGGSGSNRIGGNVGLRVQF